jgi:general stress protein 26
MPKKKTAAVKKSASPVASRPNMPGYGIADGGDGLLPWNWAVDRLTKTQNYFLCTVREDGRPHVMPIWGLWLADKFYFSTGKKSIKARNLAANPRCVLCADGADEAVIVEGTAKRLPPKTSLKEFAEAYLKKYKFDVSSMNEPVFVLEPNVTFGQIEKTFTKTATRWTFV